MEKIDTGQIHSHVSVVGNGLRCYENCICYLSPYEENLIVKDLAIIVLLIDSRQGRSKKMYKNDKRVPAKN